ncbi:hypothetical protein EMIHUDRAFT_414359, partial [Emiliania huxleyi CCMP1516]|uniref:Pre-mRNA-splicing factor SLU7 n=3 Tax=Emiliania huxleyi TaxID=2903 RepID=A0A0D3L131_EMIH1
MSGLKSSEDRRRERELEEARKAGTIPAERDADGNEINPHIPQFMAQAPWYLNAEGPGLKHQKNLKQKGQVASATDFKPRGQKAGPAATYFRKGACTNCGAMTHSTKDCVERPRKKGARYSGKDIKPDEVTVDMAYDYAGKRDHWAQFDPAAHMDKIRAHEAEAEVRRKAAQQKKLGELAARERKRERRGKGKEGGEGDSATDTDTDGSVGPSDDEKVDEAEQVIIGQDVKAPAGKAKASVRNLRIREDTAKYLLNLDVNSAYYDPKTRSMRDNPLRGSALADASTFAGDNFQRATGDAVQMAQLQLYEFEAYEKGQSMQMNADPTTVEMMNKIYREKKEKLKDTRSNKILEKYGGQQHLAAPPKELLFAQTEDYVEYDRSGGLRAGKEKAVAKSRYEEDVLEQNHLAVWGSHFDTTTFRWGYADDHSTLRNSYSTGAAGRRAREMAAAALSAPAA